MYSKWRAKKLCLRPSTQAHTHKGGDDCEGVTESNY